MHFSVIVAVPEWANLEDLLAPFDENSDGNPVLGDEVSDEEIDRFLEHYGETRKNFNKAYRKHGEDWNGNSWVKDSRGNWRYLDYYNPDARWDWWVVGGRWTGMFELKKSAKYDELEVDPLAGCSEELKQAILARNPRPANRALKKNIKNLKKITAHAVLIDGDWIEIGGNAYDYLKDIDGDVELVCVDCHE